jgi:hypothetical protein
VIRPIISEELSPNQRCVRAAIRPTANASSRAPLLMFELLVSSTACDFVASIG